MKTRLTLTVLAITVMFASVLHAAGTTSGDVLKAPTGGRALGLGGAYAAAGNDVEAINYNPAGLGLITRKEIQYMHWFGYSDLMVEHIAYAQPLETGFIEGNVGLSVVYRHMAAIANEDAKDAAVNYYDVALTGVYAGKLTGFFTEDFFKNLNYSAAFKVILESIGTYQGSTFAFDAGLLYFDPAARTRFGFAAQHMGPPMKIRNDSDPLPLTLRAGAAVDFDLDKSNVMMLTADYAHDLYGTGRIAIGIEDTIIKMFSARAGYEQPIDLKSTPRFSAGAGLSVTQFEFTVEINYAYLSYLWNSLSAAESTHVVSLKIKI